MRNSLGLGMLFYIVGCHVNSHHSCAKFAEKEYPQKRPAKQLGDVGYTVKCPDFLKLFPKVETNTVPTGWTLGRRMAYKNAARSYNVEI